MLSQIDQFLSVDSSHFPSNEQIVIGDRSRQGAFLIHYFLNLCLKQDRGVVFVGLTQSFNLYNTVSQKLGKNLISARDDKNFIFVQGLHLLSESAGLLSCEGSERNPFIQLLRGNSTLLIELIESSLKTLTQTEKPRPPVVIIDDLSILLSAGVEAKELKLLVNKIHNLLTSNRTKGSLIVLLHVDKEDEESEEIWAFLSHLSTIKLEVSDLDSGFCKDVHGQVNIIFTVLCVL